MNDRCPSSVALGTRVLSCSRPDGHEGPHIHIVNHRVYERTIWFTWPNGAEPVTPRMTCEGRPS